MLKYYYMLNIVIESTYTVAECLGACIKSMLNTYDDNKKVC